MHFPTSVLHKSSTCTLNVSLLSILIPGITNKIIKNLNIIFVEKKIDMLDISKQNRINSKTYIVS